MPRAFVVCRLNLNSFIVHSIGVHNPSPKNAVRIITGAVEYQSIANPGSVVVLVDVSTEPQFRLYFFDPLSNGAATAVTSVVENITRTQGRCMRHHDSAAICGKFAQLILQLVIIGFTVGVEWRKQDVLEGDECQTVDGFYLLKITAVFIFKPVIVAQNETAFRLDTSCL